MKTMLTLDQFPSIKQLSRDEKLEMIDLLKKDVGVLHGDEWLDDDIPEWHKQELDRRLEKMERGEGVLTDWEDIKKKYPFFKE